MDSCNSSPQFKSLEAESQAAIIAASGKNIDAKFKLYNAVLRKATSEGNAGLMALFEGLKVFYEFHGGRSVNKLTAALQIYERSLQLGAPQALVRTEIGYALSGLEDYEQASLELQQAISIDPKYVRAIAILGHISMRTGDLHRADMMFQRALTILPNFPCAQFGRILLLLEHGMIQDALDLCSFSRRTHPDSSYFELGEGLVAAAKGEAIEAAIWFRKVLEKCPRDITALWGILDAESRTGHHAKAASYLRRVFALEGPTPFVWAMVALLRWRRGDERRARRIAGKLMSQKKDTFQFRILRRLIEAEGIGL